MADDLEEKISFGKQLEDDRVLLTFESVGPSVDLRTTRKITDNEVNSKAADLVSALGSEIAHVSAILVPEIFCDGRVYAETNRYGEAIKKYSNADIVLFRVSVAAIAEMQRKWLLKIAKQGFHDIIPVGGESSTLPYEGSNPSEFMRIAAELDKGFNLGAVCIPQRGRVNRNGRFIFDDTLEPKKLLEKQQAGAKYFVTQIQYDAEHLEPMIDIYMRYCSERGIKPARIFIGVTPILDMKNLEYLTGKLEVLVPEKVVSALGVGNPGYSAERSISQIVGFLPDFIERMRAKYPTLKLGVYVESIRSNGLRAYVNLFGRLRERFAG